MRHVRRQLRKELLQAIKEEQGDLATLMQIADRLLGRAVGYEVLIKTFLSNEIANGLKQLRVDGEVESTGRLWKPFGDLKSEDVTKISTRRLKRLRGELKAEIRLAHDYGRVEEATVAARMLEIVSQRLQSTEVVVDEPVEAVEIA